MSNSGDVIKYKGYASNINQLEIYNEQLNGAISALLNRDGKLCASKANVVPEERAVFQLSNNIFIGAAFGVTEGQVLDMAIVESITTEISLEGIISADIVMTGGGNGPDAKPLKFTFTLENVKR